MSNSNFWEIFLIVFLAELPCLVRTTSLTMYTKGEMFHVITGTLGGNLAALVAGLVIGKLILHFLNVKDVDHYAHLTSGIVFILIGIYILTFGHEH